MKFWRRREDVDVDVDVDGLCIDGLFLWVTISGVPSTEGIMFTQVPPLVAAQGTGSQLLQFPATPMLSPATSFWMQFEQDVSRATKEVRV